MVSLSSMIQRIRNRSLMSESHSNYWRVEVIWYVGFCWTYVAFFVSSKMVGFGGDFSIVHLFITLLSLMSLSLKK